MALIITADARKKMQAKRPITVAVFAASGVGKTFRARDLPPKTTLFIDLEAGTLSLGDWAGDVVSVRDVATQLGVHPWEVTKAIALYLGGPDPATANKEDDSYNAANHAQIVELFKDEIKLDKYEYVFIDSITEVSRQCLSWCQTQPDAFSEKTGKADMRGAYGLLGREMIRWLKHVQHSPFTTIVVGILNEEKDDLGRKSYVAQVEGNKTANELPGIFDEVFTITEPKDAEDLGPDMGGKRRFVCHNSNPDKYPAKDRSGTLELHEPANLHDLIVKIKGGKRIDKVATAK